ncbi:MAG: hypothetical protein CMJ67_00345 [Planctomycetaceae bacterium]|nr:hypothetical protein [Planctomycetaceae bacterium]
MSDAMNNQDPTENSKSDLVDRFLALPTIWRVGVTAAIVALVFLVADDYVWPTADAWNEESDRISKIIGQSQNLENTIDRKIERVATALGPIEVPRSAAPGATRLEQTVSSILRDNGIVPKIDARTGSRLASSSPISEVAGGRVQRLVCELDFKSNPDTLINVIRELEAEPEIESISSLRLERIDDGPQLEVTLSIEAWVVPPQGGRS